MAFQFPLATVLRVRESMERREERALQRIQLEMARVGHQIEQLTGLIAKAHESREQALRQTIPAGQLQTMLWEAQVGVSRKRDLLDLLASLEQQRAGQMKAYQAAHRDHETLINMLREQRAVYEQEQARTQQKYLDDIFMARRHRS